MNVSWCLTSIANTEVYYVLLLAFVLFLQMTRLCWAQRLAWCKWWANLGEGVVLQIQATAFDNNVCATFQRMRWTATSKTVICSLITDSEDITDMLVKTIIWSGITTQIISDWLCMRLHQLWECESCMLYQLLTCIDIVWYTKMASLQFLRAC